MMDQIWLRRIVLTALLLSPIVASIFLNSGVQEIHHDRDSLNFPLVDVRPAVGDWPWWRGKDGSNVAPDDYPPARWSESDKIGWKTYIAGRGHSSPVIWSNRIFLTTTDADRRSILLICFDSDSGQVVWQTEVHRGGLMPLLPKNSHATPTPTCDGEHIFVSATVKGSLWLTALTLSGRIAWQREVGPYYSQWGYGSSPALHKSLIIVAADNKGTEIGRVVGGSYLAAIHRKTGEIVWRIRRPVGDSFGTPIVAEVAGRDQLLMAGQSAVTSYDPLTGEQLWTCRWSADRAASTIAFDENYVYATARTPRHELICIRADGHGDVTETHVRWREKKLAAEVPSPLVHQGRIFVMTDDGILGCLESETGQAIWKRRLGGTFSSSPTIGGQNLYCCNEEGTVFVLKLGSLPELVSQVSIGEGIFASPVISRDKLYLRSLNHLHCIETPIDAPLAIQPESNKRQM